MSDGLDVLISRYLDGTAGRDEVQALDRQLRDDAAARRELFLAAAMDSHLRDCLAEGTTDVSPVISSTTGVSPVILEPQAQATDRAKPSRRWRRTGWLAAAAVLAVAAGLALVMGRYPDPQVSGAYRIAGGGPAERGSQILAEGGTATLALGGYCRVNLDAGGALQIAGARRAEEIVLTQGRAVCEADRGVGTFAVRTDVGTVSVTGTRFAVSLIEKTGDKDMFDKRMAVRVLAGAVLVSGAWGQMTLEAGQAATVPPPESVLRKIVAGLDVEAGEGKKLDRMLARDRVAPFRAEYRTAVRRRLFDVAHRMLSSSMPKIMPTKVAPKIQAIRRKMRAGPPKAGDMVRIRMAMQKRTRTIMMKVIHKTADDLADAAAGDDRHIAWLLSRKIRTRLPGAKITLLDAAIDAAGITDREPAYLAQAKSRVEAAITAYDPDITGIIDPKTGQVIVDDAALGLPTEDKALTGRVAKTMRGVLAGLNLAGATVKKVEPLLTNKAIEAQRGTYCMAARGRLFAAARTRQSTALPAKMPGKVQAKVMAIRTRLKLGGPPPKTDIARIQRAAMKRTRTVMMQSLHDTADAVAVQAAGDEKLLTASLAAKIRTKLPPATHEAFAAAIKATGITGDESTFVARVERRIDAAIESYDPDISGFVDPNTGKVIVTDDE